MVKATLWLHCLCWLVLPLLSACQQNPSMINSNEYITRYEDLIATEGDTVHIKGTFNKYNIMPQFGPTNAYFISGILLEGDTIPRLFLHKKVEAQQMDSLDGQVVILTGVFSKEQRLEPGDPPHASRMTGSWLYDVDGPYLME
jgi:hypothetical protein